MIGNQDRRESQDIFGVRENEELKALSSKFDAQDIFENQRAEFDNFAQAFNPHTENRASLFFKTLLSLYPEIKIARIFTPKLYALSIQERYQSILKVYGSDFINSISSILQKINTTLQSNKQQYRHSLDTSHLLLVTAIEKEINELLKDENRKRTLIKLRQRLQIEATEPEELKIQRHDDLIMTLQQVAHQAQIKEALCAIAVQSLSPPHDQTVYEHALTTAETTLLPFLEHTCNMPITKMITTEAGQRTQALQALMLQLYDAIISQAKELKKHRRKEQEKRNEPWCELWGTKEALTVLMVETLSTQESAVTPENATTMVALFYELQKKLEEEHTNTWISNQKNPFKRKLAKASTYFYPLSLGTLPSYLLAIACILIISDSSYDETLSSPQAQIDQDLMMSVLMLTTIANIMTYIRKTQRDLALDLGQAPTCEKFKMPVATSIGFITLAGLTYLAMKLFADLAIKSYDPEATSQSAENTAEVTLYILANYSFIGLGSYAATRFLGLLARLSIVALNACGYLPDPLARRFNTPPRPENPEHYATSHDEEEGIEVVRRPRGLGFSGQLRRLEQGVTTPMLSSSPSALSPTPRFVEEGVRFTVTPKDPPPTPPYTPPEVTPDPHQTTPVRRAISNRGYATPSRRISIGGKVLEFSSPKE